MITIILSKLEGMFVTGGADASLAPNIGSILGIFKLENMVPSYFLQLAIGIYIIQVIFILSKTLVTVDAGEDRLKAVYETGKNLKVGILLYLIVSLIAIIALTVLAGVALGGMFS